MFEVFTMNVKNLKNSYDMSDYTSVFLHSTTEDEVTHRVDPAILLIRSMWPHEIELWGVTHMHTQLNQNQWANYYAVAVGAFRVCSELKSCLCILMMCLTRVSISMFVSLRVSVRNNLFSLWIDLYVCCCAFAILSCHTIYSVRPLNRVFATINLAGNSNCLAM